MGEVSAIEWTDATWTPVRARRVIRLPDAETGDLGETKVGWHCEHASEGCRNCYAENMNHRLGTGLAFKPGHRRDVEIFLDPKMLLAPLRWKQPRRIFVCSMTDLFADFVPVEAIDQMFAVMAMCPHHEFQVLTKRAARMREYIRGFEARPDEFGAALAAALRPTGDKKKGFDTIDAMVWPLPNLVLGVSTEDRNALLLRAGDLRQTPAVKRFLSCEPLIGDLGNVILDGIDWVICGGESGPKARPMHPDWARSLRDQCEAARVPFFFKQWGEWSPLQDYSGGEWPTDAGGFIRLTPAGERADDGHPFQRVGKKAAGRLLDGVEHNGVPA